MVRGRLIEAMLFVLAVAFAYLGFGLPRIGFHYEPPSRGDALRIVTWNIGTVDGFEGAAQPRERMRGVLETIALLDPSICILQEIDEEDFDWLVDTYPLESASAFAGSGNRGCALLVKRGRLVKLDVDDWRGREPVHALYRGKGGTRVLLAGMHASTWSAVARNLEIGRAVTLLESSDRPSSMRLLAGDLNLDVAVGGSRDMFTDDEYLDVQTYNYVAERMKDMAAEMGPTAEPDRRLDYVFLDSDEKIRSSAGVWRGRRSPGMDHHPVVVDVRPRR